MSHVPIQGVCGIVAEGSKIGVGGFGGRRVAKNGRKQVFLKDSENSINFRNFEVPTIFAAPVVAETSQLEVWHPKDRKSRKIDENRRSSIFRGETRKFISENGVGGSKISTRGKACPNRVEKRDREIFHDLGC